MTDIAQLREIVGVNLKELNDVVKKSLILKYVNLKVEDPSLTKTNACKKIGVSPSTLNRAIDELNVSGLKRKYSANKSVLTSTNSNPKQTKSKYRPKVTGGAAKSSQESLPFDPHPESALSLLAK